MMVHDEAVVLRCAPWSNTSRFVTWLAREHGKVVTLIRGSQRPKSWFLGQYDLFYTCDLVFYAREWNNVHTARECCPLAPRDYLRGDWRACAVASYLADVAARALPYDSPAPGIFHLLTAALDHLAVPDRVRPALPWFELRIMDLLGLRPRFQACLGCGKDLPAEGRPAFFSNARGGMVCDACAGPDERAPRPVAPDALALLGAWQRAETPGDLERTRPTPRQWNESLLIAGAFLRYHLNLPLPSRDHAIDLLDRVP